MSPERLPSKSPEGKKGNEPSQYVPLKEYRPEGFEVDMKNTKLSPKLRGVADSLSGLEAGRAAAKKGASERAINVIREGKASIEKNPTNPLDGIFRKGPELPSNDPAETNNSKTEVPKSSKQKFMEGFMKGPDAGNVARGKEFAEKAIQEGKASVEKNPPNPLDGIFRKGPKLPPNEGPTVAKLD